MSDVYKINVDVLKSYENDFKTELNNFNNKTYTTFSSSYLENCSDAYVHRMYNELKILYDDLKKGYKNIDEWWTDYNNNIEELENYLSENGSIGSITESSIRNSANQLPELKKYDFKLSGIISAGIVGANYSSMFTNNTLEIFEDPFSSLYSEYEVNKVNVSKVVNNDNIANQIDKTKTHTTQETSSLWTEVTDWWSNTTDKVGDWFNDVGAKISTGAENLWTGVTGWWSDVEEWWNSDALPWIKEAASTVWDVIKSVGATVVVFVQSLVEGILEFVEAIVDFVALVGTAVASIVTGLIDGGQAIYGAITGNDDWSSVTKEMWEGTKGFVSEQYVSGWFDSLYQNTGYGQWLAENAYGFDTVRSIGSGIGYIAGVVILTIVTFGAGSVAAAGGSVSASTAAAATSATEMAITAGAAGMGKGTQNAWADGADTLEGLEAGVATGLWEGLQFYIGGKISGLKVAGADGIVKTVGLDEVRTKLINGAARVVLDGADGGAEGFVVPLINSIYKDGYYDNDGNYIEFSDSKNVFEKYKEIFDDNGGWTTVWTNAGTGACLSMLGEGFNLSKYFKENDSTIKKIDAVTKEKVLRDFKDVMYTGRISDGVVTDLMHKTFADALEKNNVESLFVLKKFIELKKSDPDIIVELAKNETDCYWSEWEKKIVIGKAHVGFNDTGTLSHELGHCLFDSILDGELPNNWDEIVAKAQKYSSNGAEMHSFCDDLQRISNETANIADKIFEENLAAVGVSKNEYEKLITEFYQDDLNKFRNNEADLVQFIRDKLTEDEEYVEYIKNKILNGEYNAKDLAIIDIRNKIGAINDELNRTEYGDYCALSDIIDAVYKGTKKDLNGRTIGVTYQHGVEYYNERQENAPFHEIIANYTQLRISKNESSLKTLENIFGKEFCSILEDVFSKFLLEQ